MQNNAGFGHVSFPATGRSNIIAGRHDRSSKKRWCAEPSNSVNREGRYVYSDSDEEESILKSPSPTLAQPHDI